MPRKPKLWHFMLRGVCNAKIATGVRKERVSCYPLWHCCPSFRSVSTYLRDDLWNWEVSFDIHLELLAPTCSHLWPASTCSLSLRQMTWGSLFRSTCTWGELLVTSSLEVISWKIKACPPLHICVCVCVFCRKISDNCEGITFFSFGWCYIQLPFCQCWFSIDGFAKQFCVLAKFSDFKEVVPANRHWNKQQCTLTLVSLKIK